VSVLAAAGGLQSQAAASERRFIEKLPPEERPARKRLATSNQSAMKKAANSVSGGLPGLKMYWKLKRRQPRRPKHTGDGARRLVPAADS
jgi:hypothetical protein